MKGIIIGCCILGIVVIFIIVGLIKGVIPESKLYVFHKKDFDDKWETINSWCVKYCDK